DIEVEYISSESDEHPIKKSKQIAMSNFFEPKKLEKGKIDEINRILTKAFIISNISFILSGSLLQAKLARTNIKIDNELTKKIILLL
ncbi:12391_t:CDS:2, partial [Funneliformis geosporum]